MKNFFAWSFFLLIAGNWAYGEVIYLRSGEIVIGNIVGAGLGTISVRSFGKERNIPSKDILKTIASLREIGEDTVLVVLKDGTNIVGKPVDVDDELGLFVDIGFGNLALPTRTISSIYDPERRALAEGTSVNFTGNFKYVLPLSSSYSPAIGGSVSTEVRLAQIRELFLNPVVSFYHMDYKVNDKIDFYNVAVDLNILYKLLVFGEILPAVEFLVPYFGLGAGATLVNLFDARDEAPLPQYGLLTGSFNAQAGFEWRFPLNIALKTGAIFEGILQSGGLFWNVYLVAGLGYGF